MDAFSCFNDGAVEPLAALAQLERRVASGLQMNDDLEQAGPNGYEPYGSGGDDAPLSTVPIQPSG
jgi:hypothetical protein